MLLEKALTRFMNGWIVLVIVLNLIAILGLWAGLLNIVELLCGDYCALPRLRRLSLEGVSFPTPKFSTRLTASRGDGPKRYLSVVLPDQCSGE